ncbi:YdcF family protein [Candidatus Uhrbacteria bacterium]|nr:YdcF family protein [Candidatus Uhrbacteria bacterium]
MWLHARTLVSSIETVETSPVAIVFGAGLAVNNTPSDALMDRLTVASQLFDQGLVDRLLVSGDNRTQDYNEPDVMKQTLINDFGLPAEVIFTDYAGRRTYDTCRRAHELWGIDTAILVTQGYHLPRALWTCGAMGIEGTGVSATLQPYVKNLLFKTRELGAIYKAFIDLYILEPEFVGGEFIHDLDP